MVNGHTKLDLIKNFDKVLSLNLIEEKQKRAPHFPDHAGGKTGTAA